MAVLIERILGGVDTEAGVRTHCGHFRSTTSSKFVIESNLFPVVGPWYSISAYISATPSGSSPMMISFGLVGFNLSYTGATFYCSDEFPEARVVQRALTSNVVTLTTETAHGFQVSDPVYVRDVDASFNGVYIVTGVPSQKTFTYAKTMANVAPTPVPAGIATAKKDIHIPEGGTHTGFIHLTGLLQVPDDTPEMLFRLEALNVANVWLDNVMVDPHEGMYEYFDGNSLNSSYPEDFRWMGGRLEYENHHFSLWYNNYVNTKNRLESGYDEDDGAYKIGMVEEWAPTGANIVTHWDAVTSITPLNWTGDAFYPVAEVKNTAVTTLGARMSFQYVQCPPALMPGGVIIS